MKENNNYLYTKDSESLQLPYNEYVELMEQGKANQHVLHVKSNVLLDLQGFLSGNPVVEPQVTEPVFEPVPDVESQESETVSIEFSAEVSDATVELEEDVSSTPLETKTPARTINYSEDEPPIKKDIVAHFNKLDDSGRLLNVFKQYYTCMNKACGGTVRVTIKDGICSLWNYDEWEEFAFVDIFEGHLRIAIDPRYTDELKSLNLCEVPRLLSSRRNLICVQLDDLNNTVLDVLVKAFSEVGIVKH